MAGRNDLVTIFGGGGFLGRYVAQELLARGVRVRIAQRDPQQALFLKPLGGLGQTQFVAANVRHPASIAQAVRDSDAVINLVGTLKGDFNALHVEGARTIAQAARDAGVASLVHISAIGADPKASSAYARSKGEGEAAVREVFPGATILRPSVVFGPEDEFINRFAEMIRFFPIVPILGAKTRFQPVYVIDVAKAVATAALDPDRFGGQTFALGGPEVMSMEALHHWIAKAINREGRRFLPLSDGMSGTLASFGWLPGAPINRDQWQMLKTDNVVEPGAQGLEALGVHPTPLAAVANGWLIRYRRNGRFATIDSRVA